MKSSLIVIYLFFFLQSANNELIGQIRTKSSSGADLYWPSQFSTIQVYYNVDLKRNFLEQVSDNELKTIFSESFSNWNDEHDSVYLKPNYLNNLPAIGQANTIRFSSDETYLNEGVLGVTLLNFDKISGRIFSGDILLNQSNNSSVYLSKDASANGAFSAYLGDVITHELGHFLGFTHNPRIGSTMYPSLINGQHTLDHGDISGVSILGSGQIYGKVKSKHNEGVFGVPVSLFSLNEGKFVSTLLTSADGSFNFSNINEDDVYFLYQSPNKIIDSLPSYYLSANGMFCPGLFKQSFYSSCSKRDNFQPIEIDLGGSSSVDVGSFSLRCSDLVGKDYLSNKLSVQDNLFEDYLGGHHQGVFFEYEIEDDFTNSQYDTYTFDMTSTSLNGSGSYYLVLQTLNTSLKSIIDMQVSVDYNFSGTYTNYASSLNNNLNLLETEFQTYIPLSSNTISDNYVQIKVTPRWLTEDEYRGIFSYQNTYVKSGEQKYSLLAYIVEIDKAGNKNFTYISDTIEGNDDCLEGIRSVQSTPNITTVDDGTSDRIRNGKKPEIFMCGTIKSIIDDQDNSGPPSLMVLTNVIMVLFGYLLLKLLYGLLPQYRRSKFY